tara:strand:- start:93 stop:830 length:738 start_codon:yes stop_codon:yes gene_type:complete
MNAMDILFRKANPIENRMVLVIKAGQNPQIYDPSGKHGQKEIRARKYANKEAMALIGNKDQDAWKAKREEIFQQLVEDPRQVGEHLMHLDPSSRQGGSLELNEPEEEEEELVQEEVTPKSLQDDAMGQAMTDAAGVKESKGRPGDELFDEEGALTDGVAEPEPAMPHEPTGERGRQPRRAPIAPAGSVEQTNLDMEEESPTPTLRDETERPPHQKSIFDFGKGFGQPSLGDYLLKATLERMYQDL